MLLAYPASEANKPNSEKVNEGPPAGGSAPMGVRARSSRCFRWELNFQS